MCHTSTRGTDTRTHSQPNQSNHYCLPIITWTITGVTLLIFLSASDFTLQSILPQPNFCTVVIVTFMAWTFVYLFPACVFIMECEINSEHFCKKYKTLQNLTPAYSLRLIFQCCSPGLEYLFSGTLTHPTSFTWNAASFMKVLCLLKACLDASAHMLSVIFQHLSL